MRIISALLPLILCACQRTSGFIPSDPNSPLSSVPDQVSTPNGLLTCKHGFEYMAKVMAQDRDGNKKLLIPQKCSRLFARKEETVALTISGEEETETTVWSIRPEAGAYNLAQIVRIPGLPCNYRITRDGIEFNTEFRPSSSRSPRCYLYREDHSLHSRSCKERAHGVCVI